MYLYEWDRETGGYLLLSTPSHFSKEPRPVYYKELDFLGLDKYWNYKKDDKLPYMWAEANSYYYRGKLVAKTKGGSLYTAPEIILGEEPEENGRELQFVDLNSMVKKNKTIMDGLVNATIKKVYNTYIEYKDKLDVFYVAFSGGKDSIALLDIVQRSLPHNSFKVLFGDTGMEFPDTYDVVEKIKKLCLDEKIEFITAKSHIETDESWIEFGPPAQTLRWCCSVHKTTPQIIALRENLKKPNFKGMAFVGIRGDESVSRNEYEYISLGEKHKGQYSFNPILEWNSAELYLYIYENNLLINDTYKKGNSRAGCLVCPMAALKNEFFKEKSYQLETEKYLNLIKKCNGKDLGSESSIKEYLETGGWKARRNGRELAIRKEKYYEQIMDDKIVITVTNPNTDWKVWIKSIGKLITTSNPYKIIYAGKEYLFHCIEDDDGYKIIISNEVSKTAPTFSKLFKQVFHKSAYCVLCRECEADCRIGCLDLSGTDVKINDNCRHCSECHKVDKGCLVYKSVVLPKGGILMQKQRSLNCYSNHGPKLEWIDQFFELKDDFKKQHTLGSNMFDFFKRFLRDAQLLDGDNFSDIAKLIERLGIYSEVSWGIILTNLSYTPQIGWYISKIDPQVEYSRESIIVMLDNEDVKEVAAKQMLLAYKRLLATPLGSAVGLGYCNEKGNKIVSFTRGRWQNPDPLVILYSLYKFAEACGEYYQFTLTRLLNHSIDSDGVSPTQIFGLDRDTMEKILNGLTVNYPDFISASFTLDLDNITLRSDKTSKDVLKLF